MSNAGEQVTGPQFHCSVHGDQGNVIGVALDIRHADGRHTVRNYCMDCWIAMMDANMQNLTPSLHGAP